MNSKAIQSFIVFCLLSPFAWHPNAQLNANEWMTWPSTYTHDCHGRRVDQYALPADPIGPNLAAVQRSSYRNFRSTLQAGQSADNYHMVEQVGAPIVPYEHWRFPFRPFGVPYDAWGPQLPPNFVNMNHWGWATPGYPPHAPVPPTGGAGAGGAGNGGLGANGMGYGGAGMGAGPVGSGFPLPMVPGTVPGGSWGGSPVPGWNPWLGNPALQPQYSNQPWFDGTYPEAPPLDNRTDQQFFWKPPRN